MKVSRPRPLETVMGKIDGNPDMKHSFPSAHSGNSMTVVSILIFGFGFPPVIFGFTLLAGIGRLISLHHYFSDIMAGWLIGLLIGIAGIQLEPILFN